MAAPSTEGYSQVWLDYEKVLGMRPIIQGTPEDIIEQNKGLEAMIQSQSPPPDTSVQTREETANGVPVRIYTPPAAETNKKLPVGVYYHGGGYMIGSLDSEDPWCRYVAKHLPCIIVSVDYRLSPKYKQPAMIDDSVAAFNWTFENASSLGGDPSKFFTIGGSAGGGLALTVADQLIKAGKRSQVKAIIAIVPITAHPESVPEKYKSLYKSYTENGSGVPVIDAGTMKTFFEAAGVDANDEKTFVTLSKGLKEFPPTYVNVCGKDPLRDDGVVLLAMLKDVGVKTREDRYEGLPHYWWLMPGIEGGEEFLGNVVKGTKWALGL